MKDRHMLITEADGRTPVLNEQGNMLAYDTGSKLWKR